MPQSYNGVYNSYNQGPSSSYGGNGYMRENWLGSGFNQGGYGSGGAPWYGGHNGFSSNSPFYGYYPRPGYNNGYGGFQNNLWGGSYPGGYGFSGYGNNYGPPPLAGFNSYSGEGSSFGTFEPFGSSSFGPRFFPTRSRQIYPLEPEEEFERTYEPMFRPVGTMSQQLSPTNYGYSYVGYIRRQVRNGAIKNA